MQYPITVQVIRSKGCNPRLYVYVPLALAAAIGLEPGEQVQWTLLDRDTLQVKRSPTQPKARKATKAKRSPRLPRRK